MCNAFSSSGKKELTVTQSNNPQERKGNRSNWLPKIVNKDNCFKGQQRKEHNLQINRWMISNWANTKEKKCEDYRANRTEKLNINNYRNLNDHWTRFCLPNGFWPYLLCFQDICKEATRTQLVKARQQSNDRVPTASKKKHIRLIGCEMSNGNANSEKVSFNRRASM